MDLLISISRERVALWFLQNVVCINRQVMLLGAIMAII